MTYIKHKLLTVCSLLMLVASVQFAPHTFALRDPTGGSDTSSAATPSHQCGGGLNSKGEAYPSVTTAIDIGCAGKGNPIADMTFAIIRFLSAGVGLVIVGSVIVAGIQYSASNGDPQAASKAKARISSTLIALLIFIFSYALINYLTPGGFLN